MKGIEVKGRSKRFHETLALDEVSLRFEPERIYGLLGRNGAGKSTLLNIITNRIFADRGEVTIDGMPARENEAAQRQVYLMSEKDLYPPAMKVREAFAWSARFYPGFDGDYAHKAAEAFGLKVDKPVKSLSTGYRSIFKCVVALSVNAPYILLDEPVLGLDANHRELFYRMLIEKYSEAPFTCVISTHLIEEVSNVVEGIVIIKQGRVIRNEAREALLAGGYTVSGPKGLVDGYLAGRTLVGADELGGLKTAYVLGKPEGVPQGLEIAPMDLQRLFIQLTNA